MRKIETVVAATDLLDASKKVLEAAARIAEVYGARLLVVHVVEDMDQRYDFLSDTIQDELEVDAAEKVDAIKEELGGVDIEVQSLVRRGDPTAEILRLISEERADLTVLGRGNRDTVREMLVGTVAERVTAKSPSDVLLVLPDAPTDFSQVGVAVDFSPASQQALERAMEIADKLNDRVLDLIHAYSAPMGYQKAGITHDEALESAQKLCHRECDDMVEKAKIPEGLDVRTHLIEGAPEKVLAPKVRELGNDLLVLGGRGQTAAATMLLGRVATRLSRSSPCDTWISKTSGQTVGFVKALAKVMGLSGT